jgi:hypothetical protein
MAMTSADLRNSSELLTRGQIDQASASTSIILDSIGAYGDVLIADFEASSRNAIGRLRATVLLTIASVFAAALGCTWLIAATWNTPARNGVLLALVLISACTAVASLVVLRRLRQQAPPLMSRTAGEWAKDRQLLNDVLRRSPMAP